jgi:[protein-PII] uridylyltransferase
MIEQRDFSSPSTLGRFCEVVGDEERLDLLYLLTAADMRGVGGHAFPRWKDALLTSLHQLARERMREGERPAIGADERRKEILARLPEGVSQADLDRHLDLAPKRYPLEVEPFDVVLHLRLIRDLQRGADPTTAHVVDGPLRHFWVCTRVRPGLFARVAGALAARGASILSADAYTRRDGVVLDKLTLAIPPELADDEPYWQGLDSLLADVLADRKKIEDVVDAARKRVPYKPAPKAAPHPPVVKVSNKLSDRYTVIDVGVEDRVGLLYDLAHQLSELGLDIHYAKISTRANRAADVFYVTKAGGKVEDPAEIEAIQSALGAV